MKKILCLIGGHFALAPRPQKEAATAKAAGFGVYVRGVWWDEDLALEDLELARKIGVDFSPVVDLRASVGGGAGVRIRQRLARESFRRFGIASARSFGLGAPEMLRDARRLDPDLTMVHSEAGLWVAKRLLAEGFRVGVDFEDWFSEDLPASERRGRPVRQIKELERHLLHNAHLTLATTCAMAEALARDAGSERVPWVIPNCFSVRDAPQGSHGGDIRDGNAVSFYWFSQTIGPGRGLESVSKVVQQLRGPWELHLRGNLRGYDSWFEEHFPLAIRSKVHLHDCVTNEDLSRHSASHDVGLALEVPHCPSRDLTATNKIFEYLRCGLAVIASTTRGQAEVMERCPTAGWMVAPDDSDSLTMAMQRCLDQPAALAEAKRAALTAAETTWNWEPFAKVLMTHLSASVL